MIERTVSNFKRGVEFVRNNPQLLYTIFLLIAVPLAFVVSGNKFLEGAQSVQRNAETTYVASIHDALVDTVYEKFNDPEAVQSLIERVDGRDADLIRMAVLSVDGDDAIIVASTKTEERGTRMRIGSVGDATKYGYELGVAYGKNEGTYTFEFADANGRFIRGVQTIREPDTRVIGFLLTDVSMNRFDAVTERNTRDSYILAFFLILAISILLVRHARIVDYTVLYRKLAEVDKLKDDFISMAAHELRTPISVVRGYASMLVEGGKLPQEEAKQADYITRSAAQLNSLVDDLLDVMRIEQNRMEFTLASTDVGALVREVTDMLAVNAKEKNLALNVEIADGVMAMLDPDRFRQVMLNIAGNAVKYTLQGNVTVRVSAEGGKAVVRVSDTGIGISAEDQKNLFSKFYRVKSEETKAIRGTGLGLWITRQMIEKMRGTIGLESIKGRGTDVTLTFPLTST